MKGQLSIQSVVMRRVAYSYGISIVSNRGFIPGLFFGYSLMVLRELVFVTRVIESFLSSEVGQLPVTAINIIGGADVPSLLACGVMLVSVFLLCRFLAVQPSVPYQRRALI